jgi:hypothetical protein
MKVVSAVLLLAAAGPWALADEVFLKGGTSIHGVVVSETPTKVTIEVGPGQVSLPMSRVERVQKGTSALAELRARRAALAANDLEGLLNLGYWARDQGLHTQAREIFEQVVAMNPRNAAAQVALGRVRLGDQFVTPEESYRAQGLMPYQGQWVTPAEREALVQEQTEEARLRADALARRDAADRAAEAQAAAAAQAAQMESGGFPFYPGYGVSPYFANRYRHPQQAFVPPAFVRPARPVVAPAAHPITPTTSTGAGVTRRHSR